MNYQQVSVPVDKAVQTECILHTYVCRRCSLCWLLFIYRSSYHTFTNPDAHCLAFISYTLFIIEPEFAPKSARWAQIYSVLP